MIEGLDNALRETANEGTSLINFIPRFYESLKSIVGSFDDADKPLNNGEDGDTFVDPHLVDSYTKSNGTIVDSYWRDGDGDTSIDLTKEEGGGYLRNL